MKNGKIVFLRENLHDLCAKKAGKQWLRKMERCATP